MVKDAEMHAADDKRRKEEVEERNLADSAAYRAEKSISELGDKLTPEQKSELESKIADVNAALATEDIERIKSSRESLEQSFHKISEMIYSQAGAASAPGADFGDSTQDAPPEQGAPNDDTIEGEYKEM
jgi:molecular chaperone DnaK